MSAPPNLKKRKIEDECRTFNKDWTTKYFFIDIKSNAVCLICRESVAVFKEYNLKRHFQTKHGNFGKNLSETELRRKADDMVRNLKQEQTTFTKPLSVQEAATKVSFVIAHKIVKNNKPFVEGEFIKECILDIADTICPESKKKFQNISLSRRTVVRRVDAISEDLSDQLLHKIKTFKWFSLALDESTDIQDTAQLLIFIRGIDDKFVITEELLSLEHLKDTTTGQDLFDNVNQCLDRFELSLDKLASVTTDGAPSLTGKNVGLIRKINDEVKNLHPGHTILSFHCIIHQTSVCM